MSMIAFLSGTVEHHTDNALLVSVHGVGYEVFIPIRVFAEYPVGSQKKIFTYHKISEDTQALFGFSSLADIQLFKTLIGISGIGAKSALQMLELPSEKVAKAIESEDINELIKIPGLGKKTASRLVLELKGKIIHTTGNTSKISSPFHEVIDILKGLGFANNQIETLFQNIPEEMKTESDETLVKWALKQLR